MHRILIERVIVVYVDSSILSNNKPRAAIAREQAQNLRVYKLQVHHSAYASVQLAD